MRIDRRTMMAGSAAMLASAPALAKAKAAKAGWYDQAIIIDALGGVGDPYAPDGQLRLGDRAWNEMVETGVTLLRDTVFPVGNVADPWGDYQKDVAAKLNMLNANPDRLQLVRSAADILKAKREKMFGWILGTKDS
jgi:membrane dipeptidase